MTSTSGCGTPTWRVVDLTGQLPATGEGLYALATSNPQGLRDLSLVNGDRWRAAEIPAVNGHGRAIAVARFYAGLVAGGELGGVRLVSPETIDAMTAGELTRPDLVFEDPVTWASASRSSPTGSGSGVSAARSDSPIPTSGSRRLTSPGSCATTIAPSRWTWRSARPFHETRTVR
ncbi:MAG TPA: hypothetical protein VMA96_04105 [Solirubrobacteraceae bacterium]|nr:hypothetical protein [Solirubrobacteraceae bacterium]